MVPARPLRERVSVVIVTRNRPVVLAQTLARLAALADPPRTLVVDDASEHDAGAALRDAPGGTELVRLRRRQGPVARNHGVERADTPYVALTDDDCRWRPGALEAAAELLDRHPRVAVVAPRIVVGDEAREDPICAEMARSPVPGDPVLPGVPVLSFMGGAAVVRRAAFSQAGGFEPRLVAGGEEEPLACDIARAGWEMRYVAEIVAEHHPPGGDKDEDRLLGIRNALWFAWRRRRLAGALRWTLYMLRAAPLNRHAGAYAQALRGLPWVLRTRRPVPRELEGRLRALDGEKMSSEARTYG